MGLARRGGKMTTGKATDEMEGASPAVLARARYLNVVPARDTRSAESGPDITHGNTILRVTLR
jgi:hypothetical protein